MPALAPRKGEFEYFRQRIWSSRSRTFTSHQQIQHFSAEIAFTEYFVRVFQCFLIYGLFGTESSEIKIVLWRREWEVNESKTEKCFPSLTRGLARLLSMALYGSLFTSSPSLTCAFSAESLWEFASLLSIAREIGCCGPRRECLDVDACTKKNGVKTKLHNNFVFSSSSLLWLLSHKRQNWIYCIWTRTEMTVSFLLDVHRKNYKGNCCKYIMGSAYFSRICR